MTVPAMADRSFINGIRFLRWEAWDRQDGAGA